jgi:hypothetical protein
MLFRIRDPGIIGMPIMSEYTKKVTTGCEKASVWKRIC